MKAGTLVMVVGIPTRKDYVTGTAAVNYTDHSRNNGKTGVIVSELATPKYHCGCGLSHRLRQINRTWYLVAGDKQPLICTGNRPVASRPFLSKHLVNLGDSSLLDSDELTMEQQQHIIDAFDKALPDRLKDMVPTCY